MRAQRASRIPTQSTTPATGHARRHPSHRRSLGATSSRAVTYPFACDVTPANKPLASTTGHRQDQTLTVAGQPPLPARPTTSSPRAGASHRPSLILELAHEPAPTASKTHEHTATAAQKPEDTASLTRRSRPDAMTGRALTLGVSVIVTAVFAFTLAITTLFAGTATGSCPTRATAATTTASPTVRRYIDHHDTTVEPKTPAPDGKSMPDGTEGLDLTTPSGPATPLPCPGAPGSFTGACPGVDWVAGAGGCNLFAGHCGGRMHLYQVGPASEPRSGSKSVIVRHSPTPVLRGHGGKSHRRVRA